MPDTTFGDPRAAAVEEEREHPRYEGRMEAYLWLDDAWWHCWIRDLSLGGAGVEPAIPAALGRRATLASPYFELKDPLPCRIVNVAGERTNLAFELDQRLRASLARFLRANT